MGHKQLVTGEKDGEKVILGTIESKTVKDTDIVDIVLYDVPKPYPPEEK